MLIIVESIILMSLKKFTIYYSWHYLRYIVCVTSSPTWTHFFIQFYLFFILRTIKFTQCYMVELSWGMKRWQTRSMVFDESFNRHCEFFFFFFCEGGLRVQIVTFQYLEWYSHDEMDIYWDLTTTRSDINIQWVWDFFFVVMM